MKNLRLFIPLIALASRLLAQPTIKTGGIANVSGYQTTLAPGTVFVIFGSNLGPASIVTASAPTYPTALGGTSVAFTPASGSAIAAKMVYTVAGQVAGLLPSSAAPGTYAVTVTYNNQTSASQTVTVVARSFGIATSNSAGTGTVQATIGNVNQGLSLTRFTPGSVAFGGYTWTLTPAHPGDTLVIWGTGGGADTANDTGGTSGDQTAAGNFTVNVGGTQITPLYAGAASGYPGLWQINFTLPATIAPNCFAYTQVSAGGNPSNAVTIPIAATGQSACSAAGFSSSTLSTLDSGANITFSGLTVGKVAYYTNGVPANIDEVGGPLSRFTAGEWLTMFSGPQVGPCVVLDETYPVGGKEPSAPDTFMDAGATISMSGPGLPTPGTITPVVDPNGPVYINKPAGASLVAGGTYTISGQGGKDVAAFSATATIPASFAISNLSSLASISRSAPLTVNWTGTGFDQVLIAFESDVITSTTVHSVNIQCAVPAAPGSYTVPAAALAYLLAGNGQFEASTATAVPGIVTPESSSGLSATIPLVAGGNINFGGFAAYLSVVQAAKFQ